MSVNKTQEILFLTLKDIQILTKKTYRTAIRIAQRIRAAFNKRDDEFITVEDFSKFFGVKEEDVRKYLQ